MYDRWDSNKGRYVTYDYQPKGDRFSRGLSELPRAHKTIQHLDTGHTYIRRTRTDEAQALTVAGFKKMLPKKYEEGFEHRTFYLNDYKHDILAFIETTLEPPGIPVRFEVTQQHKGQRVWFVCPHCYRRVGKLYRVKAKHFLYRAWGCQKCLGLSYPSQAEHKTQARDMAIVQGRIRVSWQEQIRATHRHYRRIMKLSAGVDRLVKRYI
jgi:hypothetical protein